MSRNNTGNPLDSRAFPDFEDNVKNLDIAANGEAASWTDRFGKPRKTLHGMEVEHDAAQLQRSGEFESSQADRSARFDTFMDGSAYFGTGPNGEYQTYAAGITFTERNQVVYAAGEAWKPASATVLPYVTTGTGMPESGAFVAVGDAVLRQELADPAQGAAKVARGVVAVDSIADLLALPAGQRKADLRYLVKGYGAPGNSLAVPYQGGGEFYWDATGAKTSHDGGCTISPTVPLNQPLLDFINAVGETSPGAQGVFRRKVGDTLLIEDYGLVCDGQTVFSGATVAAVLDKIDKTNVGTASTQGGVLLIDSEIDLLARFGTRNRKKKISFYGLEIRAASTFTGARMMRLGGSQTTTYSVGRNFTVVGLYLNGGTVAPDGLLCETWQESNLTDVRFEKLTKALTYKNVFYGSVSGYSWFESCDVFITVPEDSEQISNISIDNVKFDGRDAPSLGTKGGVVLLLNQTAAGLNFTNCTFEYVKHVVNSTTQAFLSHLTWKITFERCYFEANAGPLFELTNTLETNVASGFTVQDCYFNEAVEMFHMNGGDVHLKRNFIRGHSLPIFRLWKTSSRTNIYADGEVKLLFDTAPPAEGTLFVKNTQESKITEANGWKYNNGNNIDNYPRFDNTSHTYGDSQFSLVLPLSTNGNSEFGGLRLPAKVFPAYSVNYRDVCFEDSRKGIVLRDRKTGERHRIYLYDGQLRVEPKVDQIWPAYNSISARELYRRAKYGNQYTAGQAFLVEEFRASQNVVTYDGDKFVQDGGAVWIGTIDELRGSAPRTAYDRRIYNVDIDEVWGSINGSVEMRDIGTSMAKSGTTAQRPSNPRLGYIYYDTSLTQYVQWDGAAWVNYTHSRPWV